MTFDSSGKPGIKVKHIAHRAHVIVDVVGWYGADHDPGNGGYRYPATAT